MPKTKMEQLAQAGQSIWLDYISRTILENSRLKELITQGLRGLTSNPSIFDKAISLSADYDSQICQLAEKNCSIFDIYDNLTISDVQDACDLFFNLFKSSKGADGFVSLEIDPRLALDAQKSINEAVRLFELVRRPNILIKVPATNQGIIVLEHLISQGINVNATLIFSLTQYEQVAQAYLRGLINLKENGLCELGKVNSVASVFVSRIDSYVDKLLEKRIADENGLSKKEKLSALLGKAAVANCQVIYQKFTEIFYAKKFQDLTKFGAKIQKIVWASTSTKNPVYRDIKYVTELMYENTINTLPEETLNAFLDHGQIKLLLPKSSAAKDYLSVLEDLGIDINEIGKILQEQGVTAFEKSFLSLLNSIELKAQGLLAAKF